MPSIATPLLTVLEAVLAWRTEPAEDRRERATEALAGAVGAISAAGARLVAADLPRETGWLAAGSLAARSLATGLLGDRTTGIRATGDPPTGDPPTGDPPTGEEFLLHADDGGPDLGTLWIDGLVPGSDARPVVRALELALGAARARSDIRDTAERLAALDTATRGIAGIMSVDRILQLIVDRVRELIGAQYAALGIVDDFGLIETFVTSGITSEERERLGPLPQGHGLLGLIVRENRPLRVADIGHHPASYGFPPHHPPMTSLLGVPIRVKGRSVGNFYLTNKRTAAEFSAADQQLVEQFALHAGIAIENARLHEQVQRLAVIDERVRIGKDLHDGIIQALYGIGLSLEDVPDLMREEPVEAEARVDRAIDSLNSAIRDLRNFIFGLRPELVEHGDLVAGIGTLTNELRLNTVLDADLTVSGVLPALDSDVRAEALQLTREALSNVARHSGATSVAVGLIADGETITISVADNGRGFEPEVARSADHQGLANMQLRAERLGGSLSITSGAGMGTRVVLRFPIGARPAPDAPVETASGRNA